MASNNRGGLLVTVHAPMQVKLRGVGVTMDIANFESAQRLNQLAQYVAPLLWTALLLLL